MPLPLMLAAMVPPMIGGGTVAGGAAAAGIGLSSMAMPMAMGMYGARALGAGQPSMPTAPRQVYTPEQLKLKKSVFKAIKDFQPSENLASVYIQKGKKLAQAMKRATGKISPETDNMMLGTTAMGLTQALNQRLTQAGTTADTLSDLKRSFAEQQLAYKQGFIGLETPQALADYQSQLAKGQLRQAQAAGRGEALGGLAQLLALSAYPIKYPTNGIRR